MNGHRKDPEDRAEAQETLLRLRMRHPKIRRQMSAKNRGAVAGAACGALIIVAAIAADLGNLGLLAGASAVTVPQLIHARAKRVQQQAEATLEQLLRTPAGKRRRLLQETAGENEALQARLQQDAYTFEGA